jgi:hypothetical protein
MWKKINDKTFGKGFDRFAENAIGSSNFMPTLPFTRRRRSRPQHQ